MDKRLSIAALGLGIVGLFTGGLLVLGSLAGLVLAVAALVQTRRDPARYGGRDLAWAAVAANAFALMSLVPLLWLGMALHSARAFSTGDGDSLPTPWQAEPEPSEPATLPPPPPPPPPRPTADVRDEGSEGTNPPLAPVRIGGAIREPRKIKNVTPEYPDIARQARVQGVVILECVVSPRGNVTEVRVLRGIPLLDAAAIDAVRQWRYTPTLLDGRPVPVIMTITVNFRLS